MHSKHEGDTPMADNIARPSTSDTGELVQAIAQDAGRLIEEQFRLLRSEVEQEIAKARRAAISVGLGAGLVATGGILGTLMAVHFLHRTTQLPLWGCYGLVGGLLGAAGAGLLSSGVAEAAQIRLLPPQTAETLREDAATLGRVASRAGA
jgi:hypothetical protein